MDRDTNGHGGSTEDRREEASEGDRRNNLKGQVEKRRGMVEARRRVSGQ